MARLGLSKGLGLCLNEIMGGTQQEVNALKYLAMSRFSSADPQMVLTKVVEFIVQGLWFI